MAVPLHPAVVLWQFGGKSCPTVTLFGLLSYTLRLTTMLPGAKNVWAAAAPDRPSKTMKTAASHSTEVLRLTGRQPVLIDIFTLSSKWLWAIYRWPAASMFLSIRYEEIEERSPS